MARAFWKDSLLRHFSTGNLKTEDFSVSFLPSCLALLAIEVTSIWHLQFFNYTLKIPINNHFVALLITVLKAAFHLGGAWISVMLEALFPWCTHKAKPPQNCQNKRDKKNRGSFYYL